MTRKSSSIFIAFIALCFNFLTGFAAKHSDTVTSIKTENGKITFDFIVKPHDNMMVTLEGPWSLTLKEYRDLEFDNAADGKVALKQKDFKQDLPGFQLTAKPSGKINSGTIHYELKAFVCTKDKKRCFPQTHQGTVDWKI